MNYRIRNVVIAIGLAALAAILTSFYVANYKKTVRDAEKNVTVYVAAKEIPAGTSGAEAFERGLIKEDEIARRHVVPGAISEPDQVEKLVASTTVFEGEQVSVSRFVPVESAGIKSELKGNLRAIQVPGDANQLLTGTLKKGDRVDVVATWNVPEDKTNHVSRVILRDLKVLRPAGSSLASEKVGSNVGSESVQLLLTDSQASKLEWIVENGKWRLQLRPPTDAQDSAENIENYRSLMVDGLRSEDLARQLGTEGGN